MPKKKNKGRSTATKKHQPTTLCGKKNFAEHLDLFAQYPYICAVYI